MQYNIFQNDFYDDMPGLPWAYRVTVFTGNNQTPSTILTKCVKEVSLPEMELMTYLTFYGGRAFNIPTRYRNSSSFTMKFSERNDLLAYYALRDLFSRSYDMTNTYSDFSSDMRIRVEILDPNLINLKDTNPSYSSDLNGQIEAMTTNDPYVVEIYDFTGCFVDKIDDIELDYSAEEIVEWSITVKFNDMHVKYPHQSRIGLTEDADMSERVDVPKKKRDTLGYTKTEEIRTEKHVISTGIGEGGGGKSGGGAGNPDGRPGKDGGLSATGNKSVDRHGNSADGTDAHNDNNGVSGGRSEIGEIIEQPDTTYHTRPDGEPLDPEEEQTQKILLPGNGTGSGEGDGYGDGDTGGTKHSYQELRGSFRQLIAGAASSKYAKENGIDQGAYRVLVDSIYAKYYSGELDEVQSKAFEDAMKDAEKSGIRFGSYNQDNTIGVSF